MTKKQLFLSDLRCLGECTVMATGIIIQGFLTMDSKRFDLFFDKEGLIIKMGKEPEEFKELEVLFKKFLEPGEYENIPCWIRQY